VSEQRGDFLLVELGGERYVLRGYAVETLYDESALTPATGLHPLVVGLIGSDGARVPVIDLARRFGTSGARAGARRIVVSLDTGQATLRRLAFLADSADHVVALGGVVQTLPASARPRLGGIEGVVPLSGSFVLLLDAPNLLAAAERDQIAKAMMREASHGP
jgi:chemotaxis signal transduction protein